VLGIVPGADRVHHQKSVVPWPSPEPFVTELPAYLEQPCDSPEVERFRLRDLLAGVHSGVQRLGRGVMEPPPSQHGRASLPRTVRVQRAAGVQVPELSAGFVRLVTLPASRLAATLDEWWTAARDGDVAVVDRRLELREPHGGVHAAWTMGGRVRCRPSPHWLPVVVELSPHDEWRTMLTMTPQARVFCSPRYFRTGHSVLDRLTAALVATRAGQPRQRIRPSPDPDAHGRGSGPFQAHGRQIP